VRTVTIHKKAPGGSQQPVQIVHLPQTSSATTSMPNVSTDEETQGDEPGSEDDGGFGSSGAFGDD
jgi:hypothetical protein